MKLQFELIVKITGESLQEVDQGLIDAGGERLKARILGGVNMPKINGPVVSESNPGMTGPVSKPIALSPQQSMSIDEAINHSHTRSHHEKSDDKKS